jgi:hypothetical protein
MIRRALLILIVTCASLSFSSARATTAPEHQWSVFWGLGPNFSPLGNLRLGYKAWEFGLIDSSGLGAMYVVRSSTPLFAECGAAITGYGLGVIGGVGAAWQVSSNFDVRIETAIFTDVDFVTGASSSVGLVLGF